MTKGVGASLVLIVLLDGSLFCRRIWNYVHYLVGNLIPESFINSQENHDVLCVSSPPPPTRCASSKRFISPSSVSAAADCSACFLPVHPNGIPVIFLFTQPTGGCLSVWTEINSWSLSREPLGSCLATKTPVPLIDDDCPPLYGEEDSPPPRSVL